MSFVNEKSEVFSGVKERGLDLDFSEIFKNYRYDVFSVTYSVLGDYEEAMDVTQDVFIKIFKNLSSFEGRSSLKTWILKIALNSAKNRIRFWQRRRWKDTFSLSSLGKSKLITLDLNLSGKVETPEEKYNRDEIGRKIRKALKLLSFKSRMIIVMKDIENLSYNEISRTLDIPLGTVKSRLYRAREELKNILEDPSL